MEGSGLLGELRCALFASLFLVASCDKPKAQAIAQSATQDKRFDLACEGKWIVDGEAEKPFRDTFRIDLDQGTWCRESCQRIYPIAGAEVGNLELSAFDNQGRGNSLSIDRVSGKLFGLVKMDAADMMTIATCKSAAFSGFPKTKF